MENGGPLSKRHIETLLWPESSAKHAQDCLYKVLRWLKGHPEITGPLGLENHRKSLSASLDGLEVDLLEFQRCYECREDPGCCERALTLYRGPLLWKEYYDWLDEWQSQYEIFYSVLLHTAAAHAQRQGSPALRDRYLDAAQSLVPVV